ncbi:DivIVA domain-containing protein [Selenihalanaerobacter shriftii]|uniref:Cell division initiation protein n=1 Tax=Selenihalanaerobacter shriftii TaxID=142842 RepID=A0A1T4JKI7_9FIRM|nr:DivIVA domain-containing protein [Selenihalanaerobacter shriftii]SJZ30623.1 cell division initiation protein [Selenihalanaerobacter shriftii]
MEDLLTPLEVYNKEFNKTFSMWSYSVEEVDDFLDIVGECYERLYIDNEELCKQVADLKARLKDYKDREKTLNKTIDTVNATADNQQQTAKQEAEAIIKNAQERAVNIKEQAEAEAKLIIEKAEVKADKVIEESEKEVQEKKREYKNLVESEQLFAIKFKTLLNTYLTMLEERDEMETSKDEITVSEENDGE